MIRKMIRNCLIVLVLLVAFPTSVVSAMDGNEGVTLDSEELGKINKLYQYISNLGNDYEIIRDMNPKEIVQSYMKEGDGGMTSKDIGRIISLYVTREIRVVFKMLASLVVICLICGLLTQLQAAFAENEISSIAYYVCYSMVLLIIGNSFYVTLTLAKDTINSIANFMEALMPVLIMLLASVGGFTQAVLMDPIIMFVVNFSARVIVNFVFPMIVLSFVLAFVNNLSSENKVKSLSKLFGEVTLWVQGLMLTIFVGIVTIRSMVSSSIDEVTLKTAKFTVDKFVPVVGKALSDALATIAGYSILLKNAIGSLGVIVLIVIILMPIIKIMILGFMFKLSAAIIEPISDSKIVNVINEAGKAVILILSCVICISLMCFIMIAIVAGTGKGIMFS